MNLNIHNNFIIRSPYNSLSLLDEFYKTKTVDHCHKFLTEHFSKPDQELSLYLASPVLHQRFLEYKDDVVSQDKDVTKMFFSLSKYFLRSTTRSTPFGLFAGINIGRITKNNKITRNIENTTLHCRLKVSFYNDLYKSLISNKVIKKKIKYSINNSIYHLPDDIRFTQTYRIEAQKLHRIQNISSTPYLLELLAICKEPASWTEIITKLKTFDVELSTPDIEEFIESCIEEQLIVDELLPELSPGTNFSRVVTLLRSFPPQEILSINSKRISIGEICLLFSDDYFILKSVNFDLKAFKNKEKIFSHFIDEKSSKQIYHPDALIDFDHCEIKDSVAEEVLAALKIMSRLSPPKTSFDTFKKVFAEMYEDSEVPLLQLMDADVGLGFPLKESPSTTPQRTNSRIQDFLLKKLLESAKTQSKEIRILDDELSEFPENIQDFADVSFCCLSSLISLQQGYKILIKGINNPGGAKTIGRFCHLNNDIHNFAQQIVDMDESLLGKEVIVTEICYLPNENLADLCLRPVLLRYQMPYLSKATVNTQYILELNDILVSIRNNKIILRSKRLNKLIIPRINNAHNYLLYTNPVYQFLCSIESQDSQENIGISFNFIGSITDYVPRVVYKNVIISEAYWIISVDILKAWRMIPKETLVEHVAEWRKTRGIPEMISIKQYDNILVINLNHYFSILILLDATKSNSDIKIHEFVSDLATSSSLVVDSKMHKPYSNELMFFFSNNKSTDFAPILEDKETTESNYNLGSNWIYFKIYSGQNFLEKMIANQLWNVINDLIKNEYIEEWFFVRYGDPHPHIRIRLKLLDVSFISLITVAFNNVLKSYLDRKLIWKITTDIYKPEIRRYQPFDIILVEKLFYIDSTFYASLTKYELSLNYTHNRFYIAIKSVDNFLNNFNFTLEEKINLTRTAADGFMQEFGSSKNLKKSLGNLFRENRAVVFQILHDLKDSPIDSAILSLITIKREKERIIITELLRDFDANILNSVIANFVTTCIHMFMNKLFITENRFRELEVYNVLWSAYRSSVAQTTA